jgi:glycerophosphoryl diester phosphodiesterase
MPDHTRPTFLSPIAVLAALAAGVPGSAAPPPLAPPAPSVEVQGHRGARALRPENTMAAFAYAVEAGADVLEMDVVVTRDGVPIVHHDLELDPTKCRLRDGTPLPDGRPLHAMTLAEVRALDCGSMPQPAFPDQVLVPGAGIPTLAEVLRWVASRPAGDKPPIRLNIEAKSLPDRPDLAVPPDAFARIVASEVRARGLTQRTTFQSFDHRVVAAMRRHDPTIKCAVLLSDPAPDLVAVARAVDASIVSPRHDWLTADQVRALHAEDLRVVPWTANDPASWRRLITMGVDGIITDDPAGLRAFLDGR